jgi:hypothetical protein
MTDDYTEDLYSEQVTFRTTRAMLAMVDLYASEADRSRGWMLRKLLSNAITAEQMKPGGSIERDRTIRHRLTNAGISVVDPFDPTEAREDDL